jgi:hypothetical protein
MVEVDRVCLEYVVAIHCSGVDVLVEFAGVERDVVKVVDCEGNGICGRWQEAAASAHKVLSEGHLCVETEVEASAPVSAARGPVAAPASGFRGVGVGAVVVVRHYCEGRGSLLGCFS